VQVGHAISKRGLLITLLGLALYLAVPAAGAAQCEWNGVDLAGRPVPADSWLCGDRVVHGSTPTPVPTATATPSPTATATPTTAPAPVASATVTPTLVPVREACRDAVARVQDFPAAAGGSLREAASAAVAAARAGGGRVEVDGWSASGPPPPCQVQFNYRVDGQSVRLRWEVDPTTGDVTPLDPRTAQASGP